MRKAETAATCYFSDGGESARQIILRSFSLFLKRELALYGGNPD